MRRSAELDWRLLGAHLLREALSSAALHTVASNQTLRGGTEAIALQRELPNARTIVKRCRTARPFNLFRPGTSLLSRATFAKQQDASPSLSGKSVSSLDVPGTCGEPEFPALRAMGQVSSVDVAPDAWEAQARWGCDTSLSPLGIGRSGRESLSPRPGNKAGFSSK